MAGCGESAAPLVAVAPGCVMIAMEATGIVAASTVTVTVADCTPADAVMSAFPGDTAVTIPLGVTLATDEFDEDHFNVTPVSVPPDALRATASACTL